MNVPEFIHLFLFEMHYLALRKKIVDSLLILV